MVIYLQLGGIGALNIEHNYVKKRIAAPTCLPSLPLDMIVLQIRAGVTSLIKHKCMYRARKYT